MLLCPHAPLRKGVGQEGLVIHTAYKGVWHTRMLKKVFRRSNARVARIPTIVPTPIQQYQARTRLSHQRQGCLHRISSTCECLQPRRHFVFCSKVHTGARDTPCSVPRITTETKVTPNLVLRTHFFKLWFWFRVRPVLHQNQFAPLHRLIFFRRFNMIQANGASIISLGHQ